MAVVKWSFMQKQLVLILLVLFAQEKVSAAGDDYIALASEVDFFSDIPVVVTATRLAQPANTTPAAVSVIDREMIEASGAVELVDLLRLVPGFQVAHVHGNLFTVSAHGTSAPWFSRIQVLIDGHSVYNTAFSGLDWANFGVALKDIERIEVVRGPNIATYGANAIQGTVNIITRQPFQDRGTLLQTTLGEPGRRDGLLRYTGEAVGLDYRLTLEHRENEGFDDRNDSTDLDSLSFRGLYNPSAIDELDIHLGLTQSEMGVQLHLETLPEDREVKTDYQFLRWTHTGSSTNSWYLQFSRDYYDSDEDSRMLVSDFFGIDSFWVPYLWGVDENFFPLGPEDQAISFNNFGTTSRRYDLEFQHFLNPGKLIRLAWGLGYRWDELRHQLIDGDDWVSDQTARLFGNLEWRPAEHLLFNLGAMLERSREFGTSVSPRLGANYLLNQDHTLRVSLARGYKHPSLLEENWHNLLRLDDGTPIYLYMKSNGDLQSERRDVAELGYLGQWLGDRLNFDVRLYHEEVEDAVIYALDYHDESTFSCPEQPLDFGWCYRVDNYMDYQVDGLELQLTYRTSARDFIRLHYAYADVDGDVPFILYPAVAARHGERSEGA